MLLRDVAFQELQSGIFSFLIVVAFESKKGANKKST